MAENGPQELAEGQNTTELTPDLVRKVADRVFQLLLQEARIENERRRPVAYRRRFGQGGR